MRGNPRAAGCPRRGGGCPAARRAGARRAAAAGGGGRRPRPAAGGGATGGRTGARRAPGIADRRGELRAHPYPGADGAAQSHAARAALVAGARLIAAAAAARGKGKAAPPKDSGIRSTGARFLGVVALRHRFGLDIEEAPYKTPGGSIVGQLGREAVVGDERALVDQAIRRRSPSRVRQWFSWVLGKRPAQRCATISLTRANSSGSRKSPGRAGPGPPRSGSR